MKSKFRNTVSRIRGRFIIFEYKLLRSAAWKSLSPNAKALYLLLREQYNGHNNGYIHYAQNRAAKDLHIGIKAVGSALIELQNRLLIRLITKGHFQSARAAEWCLTDLPYKGKATKDYLKWNPLLKNHGVLTVAEEDNIIQFPTVISK